tara:strand:+ start:6460 stop:7353 length:894 start_codon:yes stop_codon:yes gene_type:complete
MNKIYKAFIVGGGNRLDICLPTILKSNLDLSGVFISKNENINQIKNKLKDKKIPIIKEWRSFIKVVNDNKNSIVFFISHNKLIDPKIFLTSRLVNYHASPLPKYRGGSPMNWAIINDEKEFGVSIHELVKSTDAGPILIQEHFYIQNYDYIKLVNRVNKSFLRLTEILVNSFDIHWNNRVIQDQRLSSYFHQRRPENSQISFLNMNASKIFKMYIALPSPMPEVYFKFNNKIFIISSCKISEGIFSGQPGRVIGNYEGGVIVVCNSGSIVLETLRLKNSKKEKPANFFLKPGDQIND